MKVKQPVGASNHPPQPQTHGEDAMSDMTSIEKSQPNMESNNKRLAAAADGQTEEDAHLLSAEDVDLAFERDEMLDHGSRDNHVAQGPKVWKVKGMNLKLSALEATVTVKSGVFTYDDFEV